MTRAAWTAMLGGSVPLPEGRVRNVLAPQEPAVTLPPVKVTLKPAKRKAKPPKPPQKQLAPTREREVLAAVLKLANRHPKVGRAWRNNTGMVSVQNRKVRFGTRGSADIIGFMRDGRFLALETKLPGKRPTGEQLRFLVDVTKAGGVAGCVSSVDEALALLGGA